MMIGLADFVNANTKVSQMNHYPCMRYVLFADPTCTIYRTEKIAGKID